MRIGSFGAVGVTPVATSRMNPSPGVLPWHGGSAGAVGAYPAGADDSRFGIGHANPKRPAAASVREHAPTATPSGQTAPRTCPVARAGPSPPRPSGPTSGAAHREVGAALHSLLARRIGGGRRGISRRRARTPDKHAPACLEARGGKRARARADRDALGRPAPRTCPVAHADPSPPRPSGQANSANVHTKKRPTRGWPPNDRAMRALRA